MKPNLEVSTGKTRYSHNAPYSRVTSEMLLRGIVSLVLILLSLVGAIASVNVPHAIAASRVTSVTHSGMQHSLAFDDTSTPSPTSTITSTPTPTMTPSPTPTPTILPTPTSTSKPAPTPTSALSPTATSLPAPTPTIHTGSTPPTTPSVSSTPLTSLPRASSTSNIKVTPGLTSTVEMVSPPGPFSDQTPTVTSKTSEFREQQKNVFPFIALAIGVPGITVTLVFLLIGWLLLRKRLLPNNPVKLPPSGAHPWSRVRPNDGVPAVHLPDASSIDSSSGQLPPGEMIQIHYAQGIPEPFLATSATDISRTADNNGNNSNTSEAYEQWLHNNSSVSPDLNDPYLNELIKQFSDKTEVALQQNPPFRNEQTNAPPNNSQQPF